MKNLIIINDAPYGSEKAYNALRIANQFNKETQGTGSQHFPEGRRANCAVADQTHRMATTTLNE